MHQIQTLNTIYNGGKNMDYQKNLNYQNPYTSGQNTINQDQETKRQARVSQPQVQQQVAYTSSNIAQRQLVYPQATQGEFGQQQFLILEYVIQRPTLWKYLLLILYYI